MITNTLKHAAVGAACGLAVGMLEKLINMIPNTIFSIGIFAAIGFFAATLLWEYWQYVSYGEKPYYWKIRGIDTVVDILAGNLSFLLLLWYGGIL